MKKYSERAARLQDLFHKITQKVSDETNFIQRNRKISPINSLIAIVFACIYNKKTTLEHIAEMFNRLQVTITPQAISKHFNENATLFFRKW